MTAAAARAALADVIADAYTESESGAIPSVLVHDRVEVAVTTPAVVLRPAGWQAVSCGVDYDVDVTVLGSSGSTADALDDTEALALAVYALVRSAGWRVGRCTPPDVVTWNGQQYASVTFPATTRL